MALEAWHLALIVAGLTAAVWVIWGFTVRVQGTWARVDEGLKVGQTEHICLVQFGPFVRGRRLVPGGFQELTGLLRGRTIWITRRDHGEELIVNQGFPRELVGEIDGSVTAKMKLTLSADGRAIFGSFTPQKIEFTHRPPAITRRVFLEPSFRRYRLVSREIQDPDLAPAKPKKRPLRRTV
ncbi:MAG: hypothetical protein IPK13_18100 [Deltaproteobacteria bacterium]|nr:hypothetical protein [Deltaproteobacteria bacterium]